MISKNNTWLVCERSQGGKRGTRGDTDITFSFKKQRIHFLEVRIKHVAFVSIKSI